MDADYLAFDEIKGPRTVLRQSDYGFPYALKCIANSPEKLYVLGSVEALQEGLAIVGARKATPYGRSCAYRFAKRAAEKGIVIISGGARGCDSEAHKAALECNTPTVVFLGGGCNIVYPKENRQLFQDIVDAGGALVSENDWTMPPLPYMFRARNRLIAGLSKATLIVEAGLPSGTFSTADEALSSNKEVLVVPGSIDSPQSRGANRLIYQGATPVIDEETFDDQLLSLFGVLKQEQAQGVPKQESLDKFDKTLVMALTADPLSIEEIHLLACQLFNGAWQPSMTHAWIARMEAEEEVEKYPGGKYGRKGKRS